MKTHPIHAVLINNTYYYWSIPYVLGLAAMMLAVLNVVAWGLIGLYEAGKLVFG